MLYPQSKKFLPKSEKLFLFQSVTIFQIFLTNGHNMDIELQNIRILLARSLGLLSDEYLASEFYLIPLTGLECGDFYCTQCWIEYLTTKIMDEGASQMIECPGCNIVVDDQTVMKLITDPMVKEKYQHLITNSFVQCNRLLRWCPSPGCTNVIKVEVES